MDIDCITLPPSYFKIILEQFMAFYLQKYPQFIILFFFFCSKTITIILKCTCLFHSFQKEFIQAMGIDHLSMILISHLVSLVRGTNEPLF